MENGPRLSHLSSPSAVICCCLVSVTAFAQKPFVLHSFSEADGKWPEQGLLLVGDTLFGATGGGVVFGTGTLFSIEIDGTHYQTLHSFSEVVRNERNILTNWDGGAPNGDLILVDGHLYGTAEIGGEFGSGTIFRMDPDGASFSVIHAMQAPSDWWTWFDNTEGTEPRAGLVASNSTLFGTAVFGGELENGTLFSVNTDGSDFTNYHASKDSPELLIPRCCGWAARFMDPAETPAGGRDMARSLAWE